MRPSALFRIAVVLSLILALPPVVQAASTQAARDLIVATHAAHPKDLPKALQDDASLRQKYAKAHLELARLSSHGDANDPERTVVYNFCRDLVTDALAAPGKTYFQRGRAYDKDATPVMAVLRERFYRTWKDALPLTDASKTEIVTRGNFSAAEGAILRKHSVLVMDNAGLDAAQLSAIDSMLSLIPSTLHDLGAIGVVEFLGRFPPEIGWWDFFDGKGGEINIFGVRINAATENPFPAGVPAAKTATFCACLAHEVNHIVDAFGVAGNAAWSTRKQALLQAAGNDHLNYLRSMFADGFFAKAPQEYFASIANQWFTDSARTLQLGLAQFDNGRRDPINQALFYGEVYSQGGNSTCFYTTDADGHIKRSDVPLQRDPQGRITALKVNGTLYTFVLDGNGNVTSYTRKGP